MRRLTLSIVTASLMAIPAFAQDVATDAKRKADSEKAAEQIATAAKWTLGLTIGLVCASSAIYLAFALVPASVAVWRGHHNAAAITVASLLFSWTFIGWALCLVWAWTTPRDD